MLKTMMLNSQSYVSIVGQLHVLSANPADCVDPIHLTLHNQPRSEVLVLIVCVYVCNQSKVPTESTRHKEQNKCRK